MTSFIAPVSSRRIEAAGAITLVFGVLTALLAAAWMVTSVLARVSKETLPFGEMAVGILLGTFFVLLGWGVLRHKAFCALGALGLAFTLLAMQLVSIGVFHNGDGSIYLLILPLFVIIGNWLAWREMHQQRITDTHRAQSVSSSAFPSGPFTL
jgi:hypothetical protein